MFRVQKFFITYGKSGTSYLEDKTPNFYMQRKDRGGLIYPWKNLVKVCEISEKK